MVNKLNWFELNWIIIGYYMYLTIIYIVVIFSEKAVLCFVFWLLTDLQHPRGILVRGASDADHWAGTGGGSLRAGIAGGGRGSSGRLGDPPRLYRPVSGWWDPPHRGTSWRPPTTAVGGDHWWPESIPCQPIKITDTNTVDHSYHLWQNQIKL